MKDGRIIQHGKPEEIVLSPADDYVRTFVAHTNPVSYTHLDVYKRQIQGTWTSPPTGSQVSPRLCSRPISAARCV